MAAVVPSTSSSEIVGEAEEGPCEGSYEVVWSSPFQSGEEHPEESAWPADQEGSLTFAKVTLPTPLLTRFGAGDPCEKPARAKPCEGHQTRSRG